VTGRGAGMLQRSTTNGPRRGALLTAARRARVASSFMEGRDGADSVSVDGAVRHGPRPHRRLLRPRSARRVRILRPAPGWKAWPAMTPLPGRPWSARRLDAPSRWRYPRRPRARSGNSWLGGRLRRHGLGPVPAQPAAGGPTPPTPRGQAGSRPPLRPDEESLAESSSTCKHRICHPPPRHPRFPAAGTCPEVARPTDRSTAQRLGEAASHSGRRA
jgi:hypothetical protein